MQQLGSTALQVYEICLGGNVFGWTIDRERSFDVLDSYLAAGGNFIDTADAYSQWVDGNNGGESESIIGEWLKSRGNRADVVLATKVGGLSTAPGLGAANVRSAVEASLQRLRTEYIDLYYAHRDDGVTPIPEIYETFSSLVLAGKVRYVAASNFSGERLRELVALAGPDGGTWLSAFQALYNLVERSGYEDEVRPLLQPAGVPCLPFYSLANGFLTGKYRPGQVIEGARLTAASAYLKRDRNVRLLDAMDLIARDQGASVTAVGLAWLRAQPTVAVPTASVTNREQLVDLAKSTDLILSTEELHTLDVVSAGD